MVNYPNKKAVLNTVSNKTKNKRYSNLGMDFEKAITLSCEYYRAQKRGLFYKRPTPIRVVKTDNFYKITEAYYTLQSTTDFNGVYKGKYIDFECKETHGKNGFSFSRLYTHQREHLREVMENGGIAFLLLSFPTFNSIILLDAKEILKKFDDKNGKKSINYKEALELGTIVETSYLPRIKFIEAIDQVYFSNEKINI